MTWSAIRSAWRRVCVTIACVFLLAGLFSLVLAQVFDRAVSYKQDNDLTI